MDLRQLVRATHLPTKAFPNRRTSRTTKVGCAANSKRKSRRLGSRQHGSVTITPKNKAIRQDRRRRERGLSFPNAVLRERRCQAPAPRDRGGPPGGRDARLGRAASRIFSNLPPAAFAGFQAGQEGPRWGRRSLAEGCSERQAPKLAQTACRRKARVAAISLEIVGSYDKDGHAL